MERMMMGELLIPMTQSLMELDENERIESFLNNLAGKND
jgi:hypothetical protein